MTRQKQAPASPGPLDLLPCPFCGGKADFEEVAAAPTVKSGSGSWSVGCHEDDDDKYGMCFGYHSFTQFATKREAAQAWNRRAHAVECADLLGEALRAVKNASDALCYCLAVLPADDPFRKKVEVTEASARATLAKASGERT